MVTSGDSRFAGPELASELRALRRRSGLTLAALAQRTSYSKSSWERYLNGKALPPEAAVRAFARAVGTRAEPLYALRELAERYVDEASVGDRVPARPVLGEPDRIDASSAERASGGGERERRSAAVETTSGSADALSSAPGSETAEEPVGSAEPAGRQGGSVARWSAAWPRRRWMAVGAGAGLAALGFGAGALSGFEVGGRAEASSAGARGSVSAQTQHQSVVGCTQFECRGKDPQRLGCHRGVWTAAVARHGEKYLELRYSPACGAAWARITEGEVGDIARVEGLKDAAEERAISYDRDTYSPMVAAPYPAAARACAELTDGRRLCTPQGGASPLPEDRTDESEPD